MKVNKTNEILGGRTTIVVWVTVFPFFEVEKGRCDAWETFIPTVWRKRR